MFSILQKRVYEMVIMCVSLVGLVVGLIALMEESESMVSDGAGFRTLSLPCSLGISPDWLAGWEVFACGKSEVKDTMEMPTMPVQPDAGLRQTEVSEFRIQLFGYLGEVPGIMYCFFDTVNNRWIRLLNGQTDEDSGILLTESSAGPIVKDLSNGRRYLINRDSHKLVPVEELEINHAD